MALIKRKTRRKLSKQLNKLVKKHGPEMALALVSGIVSSLAHGGRDKADKKAKAPVKPRTIIIRKRPPARGAR
jgi:hypothetical protein